MTTGIHHITAIAADALQTVYFYTQILGLRLVKKSVNQDDPATYHLFFGDKLGHPGMDLTFFIFQPARPGKRGPGVVSKISLAVPESALEFWQKRLAKFGVNYQPITTQFGKNRLVFYDPDDQQLELVGVPESELDHSSEVWTIFGITTAQAITSFYGATLSVSDLALVDPILVQVFGYQPTGNTAENRVEYAVPHSVRAYVLEVNVEPTSPSGVVAAGTVHHIAFRAKDQEEQQNLRDTVIKLGLQPTTVIDRFYFQSVYFRTPAGILFEIATDGPGFTADESPATLGKKLALPPFLEPHRRVIERNLVPLST